MLAQRDDSDGYTPPVATAVLRALALLAASMTIAATPAAAYMGPGAGLSMIGSLVALVGAVLAGIFGFVWFPVKRMLKRRKAAASQTATDGTGKPE